MGAWVNPAYYANLSGTIPDLGAAAVISGIGVHDYASSDAANGRVFAITLIPDGAFPEPVTGALAASVLLVLDFLRHRQSNYRGTSTVPQRHP